jgi:hypothetical protein
MGQAAIARGRGFTPELFGQHDATGVTDTQFYLPDKFPSHELAMAAAIQAARRKIDVGFKRGQVVVNG